MQNAYARVAEKAFPAVVVVLTFRKALYGRLESIASGSGFFVRDDGLLVTNQHVIQGGTLFGVKMLDGTLHPAALVGASKATDLAVLRVKTDKKVPYLRFADTSKVKVGHSAIAIGAPLSLSHTMTTGVVSFKGRKLGVNNNENFIQTDASINPGNSGGPLLDIDGYVIGVNDCGMMPGGNGSIGLNFAIDASLVQRSLRTIVNQAVKGRPSFGLTVVNSVPKGKGVQVTVIKRNSAAEKAGLQVGDIICKMGENELGDIFLFETLVYSEYSPGDVMQLEILRNGKRMRLKVTLGSRKQ